MFIHKIDNIYFVLYNIDGLFENIVGIMYSYYVEMIHYVSKCLFVLFTNTYMGFALKIKISKSFDVIISILKFIRVI